jgi:hypothetical protein
MMGPINRGQRASNVPIPAPVKGLNALDAVAEMDPLQASLLDNLFCRGSSVDTRAGYALLSTQSSISSSQTEGFRRMMTYYPAGTNTPVLLAAYQFSENVGGAKRRLRVYSVNTSTGVLTLSNDIVTMGSSDRLSILGEWVEFTAASGAHYMILMAQQTDVTGLVITPLYAAYGGTLGWSNLAITGLPDSTTGITTHRNRLWFYQAMASVSASARPLSAYYLPSGAISGAVTEFSIAAYANRGGRIIALRTLSLDNGIGGTDDMAVFITDRGQAIVYEGTDPANAATWRLVGTFEVTRPINYHGTLISATHIPESHDNHCTRVGGDLMLIVEQGITSMRRVVQMQSPTDDVTVSTLINPLITTASATWVIDNTGFTGEWSWQAHHLPQLNQFIVSYPTAEADTGGTPNARSVSSTKWFVQNVKTGAWQTFSGIPMADGVVFNGKLYFTDGAFKLYVYDGTATSDNGAAITFECRQAYNYLQNPNNKLAQIVQPSLKATGNFSAAFAVDADFNGGTLSTYPAYTVASTSYLQPQVSASQYGRALALHMKGQTTVGVVSWYSTNWLFEPAMGF